MTQAYVCNHCFKTFYYDESNVDNLPVVWTVPKWRIYNRQFRKDDGTFTQVNFIGSLYDSLPPSLIINICPTCYDREFLNAIKHKWQEGYGGPDKR